MTQSSNQKIAQLIFEHCGTSEQPTEQRLAVFQMFSAYLKACAKNDFIKSAKDFFEQHPYVESVSFDGSSEYDDEGGTYFSAYCSGVLLTADYIKEHKDTCAQEADNLQEEITDYAIDYNLLDRATLQNVMPLNLSLATLEDFKQSLFSAYEAEIFDMVENYEKNLLQEHIAPKKSKTLKSKMKV